MPSSIGTVSNENGGYSLRRNPDVRGHAPEVAVRHHAEVEDRLGDFLREQDREEADEPEDPLDEDQDVGDDQLRDREQPVDERSPALDLQIADEVDPDRETRRTVSHPTVGATPMAAGASREAEEVALAT